MNAIIFGANGQDGLYLSALLLSKGIAVTGVSRSGNFLRTDIANFTEVSGIIKEIQPEYVFHLAANSTTRHDALFENHETIATGTLNILEAVRQFSPQTKVFISGSGLQFRNEGLPIKETDPFEANNAYSISRIQGVYAARYFRTLGIKVYVGYFFNHDSPLRSERHVAKKISAAVQRIAAGSDEKLEVGDLSVIKEWSFAGDIVKGIWLLINQDNIFEANISTGKGYSIKQWVGICFELAGIQPENYVLENINYKAEYKILLSDNSLIKSLGFNEEYNFSNLAEIMMK